MPFVMKSSTAGNSAEKNSVFFNFLNVCFFRVLNHKMMCLVHKYSTDTALGNSMNELCLIANKCLDRSFYYLLVWQIAVCYSYRDTLLYSNFFHDKKIG